MLHSHRTGLAKPALRECKESFEKLVLFSRKAGFEVYVCEG